MLAEKLGMKYALALLLLLTACAPKSDEPAPSRSLFSAWKFANNDTLDFSSGSMALPFVVDVTIASPAQACTCAAYFMGYESSGFFNLSGCAPAAQCSAVDNSYWYTFNGESVQLCYTTCAPDPMNAANPPICTYGCGALSPD